MTHVAPDHIHPLFKPVEPCISVRLGNQSFLNLQPENMPHRFCQQQNQRDHPATRSQIYDHIPGAYGRELGKKDGINGKPVPFLRLNEFQPSIQEEVQPFIRTQDNLRRLI